MLNKVFVLAGCCEFVSHRAITLPKHIKLQQKVKRATITNHTAAKTQ